MFHGFRWAINDNPYRPSFFRLLVMDYRRSDGRHLFCEIKLGKWRVRKNFHRPIRG